jgi:hypothetical protein
MPKKTELTTLELKAAKLVAEGKTQTEVARECGRSINWVAVVKTKALFKAKVAEFEQDIKDHIVSQVSGKNSTITIYAGMPDVRRFRDQILQDAKILRDTSLTLLQKIQQRIDDLEPEEVRVDKISPLLKQATDGIITTTNLYKQVLGIDQLIEELDSVEKAAGVRAETPTEV